MNFRFSDPIFVSWYLAGLSLLGLFLVSVIDVAPGGEAFTIKGEAVCFQGIILFALLAQVFKRRMRQTMPSPAFRSVYALFALTLTLLFIMLLGG